METKLFRIIVSRPACRAIWGFIVLAFVLRFCARLYMGADGYFSGGYSMFFGIAKSITAGTGIGFGNGQPETFRVPLYSLLLAAVTMGRELFLVVAVMHSLIGAATVWCTARLAEQLFNEAAAVIAAAITAVYPYYVVHDTALQDTSLYTLLTAVSILLLLRAHRTSSAWWALGAGLAFGADVMTRVTIAPLAVLAPIWLAGTRRRSAVVCAVALALAVAPWLIRQYRLTGVVTLSTETGLEVWNGNNALTFSHYPEESSDLSKAAAFDSLTLQEREELEALSDEAARERWFLLKGLAYIREHPGLAFTRDIRKIVSAFGWLPSPRHGRWGNLAHAVSYGPVMTLGLCGMWLRREHWREEAIIYAAFVSFAVVTALIFGHTSHRVYLDVYWIAFAAGTLERLRIWSFNGRPLGGSAA
jgi:4-amino-4-deoxy-L-arabinose transferase-like glycosyltransferase